jgi:hypothetical protein
MLLELELADKNGIGRWPKNFLLGDRWKSIEVEVSRRMDK